MRESTERRAIVVARRAFGVFFLLCWPLALGAGDGSRAVLSWRVAVPVEIVWLLIVGLVWSGIRKHLDL